MSVYEYRKLRGRIVEKYGSQRAFSEKLGDSYVAVSNHMRGISGFSQEDIVKWSEALEIKPEEYGAYFFA